MFFPDRIKGIRKSDKVLEIGPGSAPHSRSDIYLEKFFYSKEEEHAQRGYSPSKNLEKPIYYYDGKKFPFSNNEFDYVICSHVLEHVPLDELRTFFSEMTRVSSKGYIEFPNIFYELINYQDVHLWFMNYRDGKILFLDKSLFTSNNIHMGYRELFYANIDDRYANNLFSIYKDFFFCGFEWENKIDYEFIDNFNELVTNEDLMKIHHYFKSITHHNYRENISELVNFVKKNIIKGLNLKKPKIHKSASLENRKLIFLDDYSEIQNNVIIKTYKSPVIIGKYSQINPFCVIYGGSGVTIGDYVMIAPHCMIVGGNHNYKQVDTPMRFSGSISKGPIRICNDVWIGANCTIGDGVTIGEGAVISANSFVNRNVEPYSIVRGVPAIEIGRRY
ncbi:methyltransferase domain-containing protein [Methanospirillum sp.]